jgi:hypothetical protein
MLSGSSPVFALFNHTTFSQTQTDATVPLNPLLDTESFKFKVLSAYWIIYVVQLSRAGHLLVSSSFRYRWSTIASFGDLLYHYQQVTVKNNDLVVIFWEIIIRQFNTFFLTVANRRL